VNGSAIDNANNYWVAYNNIGLAKYNGSAWTVYDSLNSPLPNNKILSVAAGATGIWAGTNSGLFFYDGVTWTSYNTGNSGIPFDSIPFLYAKGGEAWIYSNSGVVYFNGTTFQQYTTLNSGLVNDSVTCVFKDAAGTVWFGTKGGLSQLNGTVWQSYTTLNSNLADNYIRSLTEDGNHYLFVGTNTYGVLIKQGNNFVSSNTICDTHFDQPHTMNLFSVSDGSVLLMNNPNTFITTNPIASVMKRGLSGWYYLDTLFLYCMDNLNRVWRIKKTFSPNTIKRMDSITTAPLDPGFTAVTSTGYAYLDINEVSCPVWDDNTMFWDARSQTNVARYEVPKGCTKTAVFASALWFGGMDAGSNLHVAAQTYRQGGNDFWPGPLDTTNASIDSATVARYDSVWKVNRDTVNEFINQFNLGNVSNGNYPVPYEIATWPANAYGNSTHQLAPYIDSNGDGIYNPYDGDYPDMKGDQMLWWVMNDMFSQHGETQGTPFGMEVQCEAYAYKCAAVPDSMQSVNYTTFYSCKIINRSLIAYHNMYAGIFSDVDLGNATDDMIGCRVPDDYDFVYNGDNDDEGAQGYGTNPPMTSFAILKGPAADAGDGIDNNHNGVTDEAGERCMLNHFFYFINAPPNSGMGDPIIAPEFYNYLTGYWKDGTPLHYGGNGYTGSIPANCAYTGIPYDTGWTELSVGNTPDDRRMEMSMGPFTFYPGEMETLDYAVVFSWDRNNANGAATSVLKNHHDVMQIKSWFESDNFPCHQIPLAIDETKIDNSAFKVFPNPASGRITVDVGNTFSSPSQLQLFDISGREILSQSISSKRTSLDVSAFEHGIYFIKISDNKNLSTKKIVLQ